MFVVIVVVAMFVFLYFLNFFEADSKIDAILFLGSFKELPRRFLVFGSDDSDEDIGFGEYLRYSGSLRRLRSCSTSVSCRFKLLYWTTSKPLFLAFLYMVIKY